MWTVLERSYDSGEKNKAFWLCRCDCGTVRRVRACNLLTRATKSCGCITKTDAWKSSHKPSGLKHGMTNTKEYRAWRAMINRCENPNVESYPRYGGRGISVFPEWRESFEAFLEYVGMCPAGKNSIGRKDSDKNYEPGNVQWEDIVEQNNNKSDTLKITFQGTTLSLSKWCERLNLPRNTIASRIRDGWTAENAFTTPIRHKRNEQTTPRT